jgi:hypothetical protein
MSIDDTPPDVINIGDPCLCVSVGYCPRHRLDKTPHMLRKCQNSKAHREVMDEAVLRRITVGEGKYRQAMAQEHDPNPPRGIQRMIRFAKAGIDWAASGFLKRSPERVAEIFDTLCEPCDHYIPGPLPGAGSCAKCTCHLNRQPVRLNKILWATASCPLDPPKWVEEDGEVPKAPKIKYQAGQDVKSIKPPKCGGCKDPLLQPPLDPV